MCICLIGCCVLCALVAIVILVFGWAFGRKSGRKAAEREFSKTLNEKTKKRRDLWEGQTGSGCMETCSERDHVHELSTWPNEEERLYYLSEKGTTVHISNRCRGLASVTGAVRSRKVCLYCQEMIVQERNRHQASSSTDKVSRVEKGTRNKVSKKPQGANRLCTERLEEE